MVGRARERAALAARYASGRAVVLSAPRRFGKTSLIRALAEKLTSDGLPNVIVDLYGVQSLADVNIRLRRAYGDWGEGRLRDTVSGLLRGIDPSLRLGPVGLSLARGTSRDDELETTHALLDLPRSLLARHGHKTWVVFDEFQSAWNVAGLEELIRTYTQQHADAAAYVFAGSHQSLLERMFTDRGRPFYAQAEVLHLGPVGSDALGELIDRLFAQTERHVGTAVDPLLRVTGGHPQRTMLAAHVLWTRTALGAVADESTWSHALDDFLRWTQPEMSTRYRSMTASEQRSARALALFDSPFAKGARTVVGDPATGTVSAALSQLARDGDVVKDSAGHWRFTDPALPLWLQQTYR